MWQHTLHFLFPESVCRQGDNAPACLKQRSTDVALSFVNTLTEQATETVTIRTFSNQKPWVDRSTRDAVNHRTAAYNAGLLSENMSEYKASCYTLRRAVRAAKRRYRERIESLSSSMTLDACGRD